MRSATSVLFALALSAPGLVAAAPKVLICADDGGDGGAMDIQAALKASNAFAQVDLTDCSFDTPTLATLKKYEAVLTFDAFGYADPGTLGNAMADYVDAGGGVVQMMFSLDSVSAYELMGRWEKDDYNCILTGDTPFNPGALKALPNEPQSPLVLGVGGISSDLRADGKLNKVRGAISVWDWDDGTIGVCRMQIKGRQRVDINFYPGQGAYAEKKKGDAHLLIKNALLFVSGGFNPLSGKPNPVAFPDTGTFSVSTAQIITYTNTAIAQQSVTKLVIGGTHPAEFVITKAPQLPLAVAPNGTFTVEVAFAPTIAGVRSAVLQASVLNQMSTGDVDLSGKALPSQLSVTPNPLAMGGTQVGTPVTKVVSIANKGGGKVTINGATIAMGQGIFSITGNPGFPVALAPGGVFTINVAFAPLQNGAAMGLLTITSTDPNNPTINVPVAGCAGPSGIALDAASLGLGAVNLGATFLQPVTVTNAGCADLKVTDLQMGGVNPGDFPVDKAMLPGTAISAGQSRIFNAVFKPTQVGMRSATVTVLSNAGNKVLNLFGTGTTVVVKVAPLTLAFGNVRVKTASMPLTTTVANPGGTGTLKVLSLTFSGAGAAAFTTAAMPTMIAPNASFPVAIVCTPPSVGPLAASLTITTDVGNTIIPLTCTGSAPIVQVKPASLDFGGVPLNIASAPQTVTITNAGTDPLTVEELIVLGDDAADFSLMGAPMMGMKIAAKGTATFKVIFTPSNHAAETAEVSLATDDPATPVVKIALKGSGVQAGFMLSTMVLDFGPVAVDASAKKPLTVTNTGDSKLTVAVASPGGAFTLDMKGPLLLDPGKSATIQVTFAPTTGGAATANILLSAPSLAPATVKLTGNGVGPMIGFSPGALDFGPVEVGTTSASQTVTFHNKGGAAIIVEQVVSSDPAFAVTFQAEPLTVSPQGMGTFTVTFHPTAVAESTTQLGLVLAGKTTPSASVPAKGTGVDKRLKKKGGCACDLGGARPAPPPLALLLLLLLAAGLLALRRRSRVTAPIGVSRGLPGIPTARSSRSRGPA